MAGQLWDTYEKEKAEGKNPSIPVAGIVLHAALYSGRWFDTHSYVGSSFPCGCLIKGCDPLNNAQMIKKVKV